MAIIIYCIAFNGNRRKEYTEKHVNLLHFFKVMWLGDISNNASQLLQQDKIAISANIANGVQTLS